MVLRFDGKIDWNENTVETHSLHCALSSVQNKIEVVEAPVAPLFDPIPIVIHRPQRGRKGSNHEKPSDFSQLNSVIK